MKVEQLTDKHTNKTVWAVTTDLGGCLTICKTRKAAEKALKLAEQSPALSEYWANSSTGSTMYSYATGRYVPVTANLK